MKKILLATVFLATPTIFCMESNAEKALAERLKQELGAIFGETKKPEQQVATKETMSIALQKAFGNHGPEHVEDGCIATMHYSNAGMNYAAWTYVRGFLDATKPKNEYERIVYNMLKSHVKTQAKL